MSTTKREGTINGKPAIQITNSTGGASVHLRTKSGLRFYQGDVPFVPNASALDIGRMGIVRGEEPDSGTVITVEGFTSHRDNGQPHGEYTVKNVIPIVDPASIPTYVVPIYMVELW